MKFSKYSLLLILLANNLFSISVIEIRELCKEAVNNKVKSYYLYNVLRNEYSDPLKLGYLGVTRALHAKHTTNLFIKYKYFMEGKNILEKAIAQSPKNMELRFLRFTTQSNTPAILNYKQNISEDKLFLISGLSSLKDSKEDIELKVMIAGYLLSIDSCTPEEKEKIKQIIM